MRRSAPVLLASGLAVVLSCGVAQATYTGGSVVVTQHILLATTVQSGQAVYCALRANSTDANGINQENVVVGTATMNGSTASCTQTIHWWWNLSGESSDSITVRYMTAIGPSNLNVSNCIAGDFLGCGLVRVSTHTLTPITPVTPISLTVADKL